MSELCAIILAAGQGTRMKSNLSKVLHPLLGSPLGSYPLEAARCAGVGDVVVVVGHQGEDVRGCLEGPGVRFVEQDRQLGTADAVARAKPLLEGFTGTGLILCGDVPLLRAGTLEKLISTHRERKGLITVLSMELADPTGYGRLIRDGQGNLEAIVEQRDADETQLLVREVNSGTYAVELPWLWDALDRVDSDNAQGEFYLTDAVALAAGQGAASSLILDNPEEAMGINSRQHLAQAGKELRRRINEEWMEAGVTLEDPATTWIEPGVELAPDVTLGPGVRLEGRTTVATGARIDTGVIITDSAIGQSVHVKPYCVISDAVVGAGAAIGPFAHLRPGADVGEEAKVGNFVEMKKSRLGRGAKASHLTYLGDAEVGEEANIGAGTITCNYDGVNKFRTVIGPGAFIGSNTSLVAPVSVGAGAVTGAGSTITREVEDDALAVSRAKQRNLQGWKKPEKQD